MRLGTCRWLLPAPPPLDPAVPGADVLADVAAVDLVVEPLPVGLRVQEPQSAPSGDVDSSSRSVTSVPSTTQEPNLRVISIVFLP